ncbi:MAG: hypothetical protein B0A82_02430 [Alkalinema sp. CACIAM 70d]|nr:MAG: hypothetical protein B0A82_02430 [Alkalinema sp. CACIAM 70d]
MAHFSAAREHFIACHQHPINQALHHFANFTVILSLVLALIHRMDWKLAILLILLTQPLVWAGHAVFEKNQPAFIKYPGITILASLSWSFERLFGLKDIWLQLSRSSFSPD